MPIDRSGNLFTKEESADRNYKPTNESAPVLFRALQNMEAASIRRKRRKPLRPVDSSNFQNVASDRLLCWLFAVPAMWNDGAKQTMKRCAELAGLVRGKGQTKGSPFPLIIVLEPEAASIYCQNVMKDLSMKENEPYLVVDAGGGTVDLVMHEKKNGGINNISESSGGTCGGSYVDENFFKYAAAKVPFFTKWAAIHHAGLYELKREWLMQKVIFKGGAEEVGVRLPLSFADMARAEGVQGNFQYLIMTGAEMAAVFNPVVEDVLQLIREQLANPMLTSPCQTMLLVGGFAESDYLFDKIRAEFKAKVPNIVRPPNPASAIIQGAVSFGFNPRVIMNHKARFTYGIAISEEFSESRHDPAKKFYADGRVFCSDRFLRFVSKGEDVQFDDEVEHTVYPITADQKSVSVTLYSTKQRDPEYVTDEGMHKESSFVLDIAKSTLGTKSKILVSLRFGATTIEVRAKGDNFAGDEASCSVTGHYDLV
jgi:hypothetical protein